MLSSELGVETINGVNDVIVGPINSWLFRLSVDELADELRLPNDDRDIGDADARNGLLLCCCDVFVIKLLLKSLAISFDGINGLSVGKGLDSFSRNCTNFRDNESLVEPLKNGIQLPVSQKFEN